MNEINRICSLTFALVSSCVLLAAISRADEPSVAALKEAIPILSPDNQSLNSFHFVGEFVTPLGVPVAFEACWSRAGGFGFAQVDHLGHPVLFIAENKMLLYDASQSQVNLDKDVHPNVVIQSKDRQLTAVSGFKSTDQARFIVDLPSLVPTTKFQRELSRVNANDWKLTYSIGRDAEVAYVFQVDREITLNNALLTISKKPIVTVRNISINQPVPERLMKFPDTKTLSSEATVKTLAEGQPAGAGAALDQAIENSLFAVRAMAASAAINDAKHRGYPFLSNIDWKQVGRNHERIGTRLSALLNIDVKERVIR